MLISDKCQNNRVLTGLGRTLAAEKAPVNLDDGEKYRELLEGFTRGRSSELSLCLDGAGFARPGTCPAGHAVVAIGSRWNGTACQIKIRNSWGEDSRLSGWFDADQVLPAIDGITYINDGR